MNVQQRGESQGRVCSKSREGGEASWCQQCVVQNCSCNVSKFLWGLVHHLHVQRHPPLHTLPPTPHLPSCAALLALKTELYVVLMSTQAVNFLDVHQCACGCLSARTYSFMRCWRKLSFDRPPVPRALHGAQWSRRSRKCKLPCDREGLP